MEKIDSILTSCNRFDLLEKTLFSFYKYNTYPIDNFIVWDDSGKEVPSSIKQTYHNVDFRDKNPKLGQIKAIDTLFSLAKNNYIFFQEDDWEFFRSGFIEASKSVLSEVPNCSMVWIRNQNDRNGHPAVGSIRKTKDRVQYQRISDSHGGGMWAGFSFNPGLRRKADYDRIFPNDYGAVAEFNPKTPWAAESAVGKTYKRAGMSAFTLLSGYVKHTGDGRHIQ